MDLRIKINYNKNSITATIYKNDVFYTEIGCADLSNLFKILSEHEIAE